MDRLIVALGETDCERIGDGWLAQPVNALTSLVFSVVGFVVIAWALGVQGIERRVRYGIGLGLVASGIGSFLYHGPQTAGSQFLHDITFLATLALIGLANLRAGLSWSERTMWVVFGVALGAISVILLGLPEATNVFTGLSIVLIVGAHVVVRRHGRVDRGSLITAVLLLGASLVFFALGRSGGWLCDADSLWQGHGAWHVLAALALAAYAVATSPARMGES